MRGDRCAGRAWRRKSTGSESDTRITGGGFGGCTVSIVKNEAVDTFIEEVQKGYQEKCHKKAEIYVVDIGDGAHRLS